MSSDFWDSSPFLFRLYQTVGSPTAAAHCKAGTGVGPHTLGPTLCRLGSEREKLPCQFVFYQTNLYLEKVTT